MVGKCYTPSVTEGDVVSHWRKGARDALSVAKLAHRDGFHELALFNCHLAVEKALKAAIMEKTGKPHPKIHELPALGRLLKAEWSPEDRHLLDTLSDFAVAARYDDPAWAEREATAENGRRWIDCTEVFLTNYCP